MRKILLCSITLALAAVTAVADVVPVDGSWHEFLFGLAGTFVTSCGGTGCVATIDPVAEQTSAPPWTFAGPAVVTITDLFGRGDRLELFDNGAPVGLTSVPVNDGAVTCPSPGLGNDILACLADPTYSHGVFTLGGGAHSLTIEVTQNALGTTAGVAVFQVVPEPSAFAPLLGIGLFGLAALRRNMR